jgi:hypothetical protein
MGHMLNFGVHAGTPWLHWSCISLLLPCLPPCWTVHTGTGRLRRRNTTRYVPSQHHALGWLIRGWRVLLVVGDRDGRSVNMDKGLEPGEKHDQVR